MQYLLLVQLQLDLSIRQQVSCLKSKQFWMTFCFNSVLCWCSFLLKSYHNANQLFFLERVKSQKDTSLICPLNFDNSWSLGTSFSCTSLLVGSRVCLSLFGKYKISNQFITLIPFSWSDCALVVLQLGLGARKIIVWARHATY
jgi:hypothetical protein